MQSVRSTHMSRRVSLTGWSVGKLARKQVTVNQYPLKACDPHFWAPAHVLSGRDHSDQLRLPLMFYPAATIPTNFAASFDSSGLKMRPHWCPSRLRLCHHFVDASVGSADTTGLELTLKGQHVALQRRERLQGSISWVHPITCSPIRTSYLPIPKKDCRIKCWAQTKMQGRCDMITAEVRQEGGKMNMKMKRAGNDAYLG